MPCWYATIKFGQKTYHAVSTANIALQNLLCLLPWSKKQKVLDKLWDFMHAILFMAIPIFAVKYSKIIAETYFGYIPRGFWLEPIKLLGCWIGIFITSMIIGAKLLTLIEKLHRKIIKLILKRTSRFLG